MLPNPWSSELAVTLWWGWKRWRECREGFLPGGVCLMVLCCLPDSKGLSNPAEVEALREKVYASLEAYCKHKYPDQPGR